MQLRGRFTFWFVLAALVPIAAATLVSRGIVTTTIQEDARKTRESSEQKIRQMLEDLSEDVVFKVQELATREDPYVGGTLLDLDTHDGALPTWAPKRLEKSGTSLMRQLSLDLLYLLDHRTQILDSPHYPPALGEDGTKIHTRAKNSLGRPYYEMEKILDEGRIMRVLVVESARTLIEGMYSVTVVGGRRIDHILMDWARKVEPLEVRVVAPGGEVLISSEDVWTSQDDIVSYPLRDSSGHDVATVEVWVRNHTLPGLLAKVSLYSLVLALSALAITIILGYWVARRITRDLRALVVGARAAARGELDHQVEIHSNDEIGAVGEAFNTMMVDLKDSKERLGMAERVAAWQEIARRLAHEIKNPLTPIQMSMETLRKTYAKQHPSFDEVFEEATSTVLEEAGRLKRIVAEFSEFARIPNPSKKPMQLNELVRSQSALYHGSLEIEQALDDELPLIEADKDSVNQLLLNLLENGRDAIGDAANGMIRVTTGTSQEGKAVILYVDDNGGGIAAESREQLFTPYFTTKHAQGGTGLGLAIVHRIVSDHGGKIWVDNGPLGGARVTVEFPVRGNDNGDDDESS